MLVSVIKGSATELLLNEWNCKEIKIIGPFVHSVVS